MGGAEYSKYIRNIYSAQAQQLYWSVGSAVHNYPSPEPVREYHNCEGSLVVRNVCHREFEKGLLDFYKDVHPELWEHMDKCPVKNHWCDLSKIKRLTN